MKETNSIKKTLLLLHGALGNAETFLPLKNYLEDEFEVLCLDFEGHGKSNHYSNRPFRMEFFAENVLSFLEERQLLQKNISVLGYSMGGYVALLLAKNHPHLFRNVFTLGTKFFWTEEVARRESQFLNPEKIESRIPHFAQTLKMRFGEERWKLVVEKTADLLLSLGSFDHLTKEVLKEINTPVRIGIGDRDQMAGLENSMLAYQSLPKGELVVWPRMSHPLELMDFSMISSSIKQFC